MNHHLQSAEIRQMYDLLYKYERKLRIETQKDSITIAGLDSLLQTNDIFIGTVTNINEQTGKAHNGYILFMQANAINRDYHLIRHIRNAFAHGFVELNKQTGRISFKDGKKKIKSELPRQVIIPLFQKLNKVCIIKTKPVI